MVNAMASELFFSGHGKIARLSLLDPGSIVKRYNVDKYRSYARSQIGALNKVNSKVNFMVWSKSDNFCSQIVEF